MRPFLLRLLATAFLTIGLSLAACGENASTPERTPAQQPPEVVARAPHPIEFVEGFAAGREAAGADDALIFVYVGRHHPT